MYVWGSLAESAMIIVELLEIIEEWENLCDRHIVKRMLRLDDTIRHLDLMLFDLDIGQLELLEIIVYFEVRILITVWIDAIVSVATTDVTTPTHPLNLIYIINFYSPIYRRSNVSHKVYTQD